MALWVSNKFLDRLHDETRVKALCVVPGTLADISAWRQSVGAADLKIGQTAARPSIADPVVERAMVSLTRGINQNNQLITPDEKSEAILTLEILRDGGHAFTADELHAWALSNGWYADTARQLQGYANGVLARRRYRIDRGIFRRDILEYWREESGEGAIRRMDPIPRQGWQPHSSRLRHWTAS